MNDRARLQHADLHQGADLYRGDRPSYVVYGGDEWRR